MNQLSVCAIVKDEAPYLPEWIEFHLLQGVEHFYIYNHMSTDSTVAALMPYVRHKIVTLTEWQVPLTANTWPQILAYEHCINTFRHATKWCAFIDADEFLHSEFFKLPEILALLKEDVSCVLAHWMLYGSNGHTVKEDGLVIERFTKRSLQPNPHVKSIVRMNDALRFAGNPHRINVRFRTVRDTDKTVESMEPVLNEDDVTQIPHSAFKIAHYHVKSASEYRARCNKGRVDVPVNRDFETSFKLHDVNEISDISFRKYVPIIKHLIASRYKSCLL